MTSYIPEGKEKTEEKPGRQEKALEALLGMIHSWKSKGTSVEEAKKSIGQIQGQVLAKFGKEIDPSKINLGHLFSLLMKPGHFNPAEKKFIQALFMEAAKLKKKLDIGEGRRAVSAKNKNRFKRPVEKKYI